MLVPKIDSPPAPCATPNVSAAVAPPTTAPLRDALKMSDAEPPYSAAESPPRVAPDAAPEAVTTAAFAANVAFTPPTRVRSYPYVTQATTIATTTTCRQFCLNQRPIFLPALEKKFPIFLNPLESHEYPLGSVRFNGLLTQ
jgi:hypothetical protein